MTHDEILELSYRAMRDEGASAEECIERFLRPHPLTPSPSHGEGESVEEIAEQIRALEGPLEFRRSVAVAPSAGERKAAMLRSLGQPRQGWLERLVASPVRGGLVALLALTVVGASTAGAANVGGVRDSIGEALGLVQPEGECAGSLPADEVAVCSWGQAFGTSTPAIADPTLDGVQAVAIGREHTLALLEDGTLLAWGSDEYGQLGNGPGREDSLEPVEVPGLEDVTDIAAGDYHSIALLLDGTVVVWGQNDFGQLGTGDFGSFDQEGLLERHVIEESPRGLTGLTGVVDVAAGGVHSVLLNGDGTVADMGSYLSETPGQAVSQARALPTSVSLSSAVAIASGANHALALLEDGRIASWGSDENGQLGDGEQTSSTATRTVDLDGAVGIAAGGDHSVALLEDGTVRTWGSDEFGQLGDDGELEDHSSPVQVDDLLDVVGIAAGEGHSLALLRDGSLRAWGRGSSGQLGDGSEEDRPTPVRVNGLRSVETIFAGAETSLALRVGIEGDFVAITKGDWVGVTAADGCADPSELPPSTLRDENRRLECPPNGTVLQVVGGPDEFQGQRFWALSGFGWFNETYLAFHHEGPAPYPEREELSDQGLIAYVGPDQGLWLMNADGSDRHRINRGPVLTQPQWSPDGRLIAFGGEDRMRIVDLWGAMLVDLPGYLLSGNPWGESSLWFNVISLAGEPFQAAVDGTILPGTHPASSFNLLESPTGDDWEVSQMTTIVYPEFSPAGVSDWVVVTDREGEQFTILANGSLPAWQPAALNEEPAETPEEAAQGILRYYPDGPFSGDCGAATATVCVREIGRSGNEIVFEVVRLQLEQPQQVVLLFVRPEDDGYVAGHLEPAFCQGDPNCPPPAGATVEIVVKETCVNARQEPSRLGPINRCLRAGERYFLTGESEEADGRLWVELLDAGWVSASYIRCVEACGEAAIPLPCSGGPCPPPVGAVMEVTIQSGCLNARVAPGLESEATSCLPDGHTGVAMTFETALAGGFQWIFLHNAGWVAANYTRCVRECGGTS